VDNVRKMKLVYVNFVFDNRFSWLSTFNSLN